MADSMDPALVEAVRRDIYGALAKTSPSSTLSADAQDALLAQACAEACDVLGRWLASSSSGGVQAGGPGRAAATRRRDSRLGADAAIPGAGQGNAQQDFRTGKWRRRVGRSRSLYRRAHKERDIHRQAASPAQSAGPVPGRGRPTEKASRAGMRNRQRIPRGHREARERRKAARALAPRPQGAWHGCDDPAQHHPRHGGREPGRGAREHARVGPR